MVHGGTNSSSGERKMTLTATVKPRDLCEEYVRMVSDRSYIRAIYYRPVDEDTLEILTVTRSADYDDNQAIHATQKTIVSRHPEYSLHFRYATMQGLPEGTEQVFLRDNNSEESRDSKSKARR